MKHIGCTTQLDSISISMFVDVLVELTNTICQFNQYTDKYWDGSAVYLTVLFNTTCVVTFPNSLEDKSGSMT